MIFEVEDNIAFFAAGAVCALFLTFLVVFYSNSIFAWRYAVPQEDAAVFITACGTGLGRAAAEHFVSLGYFVFAAVRNEEAAESLKRDLGTERMVTIVCDVGKSEDVSNAKEVVQEEISRRSGLELFAVINNAGAVISEGKGLSTSTLESLLNMNVVGAMRVIEAFLPLLKETEGRVVNVAYYFGSFSASMNVVSYSASRAALEGLSDGMRRRYRPHGISVSLVKPGNIKTKQNMEYGESDESSVMDALEHAVGSAYPSPQYLPGTVGGFPYRWLNSILSMTPERFGDKLLKLG